MNRYSALLSFRRWSIILSGSLLVVFAGFYFFYVSAQTEAVEKPTEQNLVNGRLAFSSRVAGPTVPFGSIIAANPDGSGRTSPVSGSLVPSEPVWSPDATKIAFAQNQPPVDIYTINTDGSGQANLTNTSSIEETNPSWSASGKIAYQRSSQIWVMNADGSGQAQFSGITQPSPTGPAWSPDGMKLAFSSGGEIWVIDANGTNELRLTITASTDTDPAWSPDGSKVVFTKGGSGVAVINADGTNETTLSGGSAPSWSPDGTKIAYQGSGGLWTMDANGGNQVRIVANVIQFPLCCDTVYENPAWQPVAQAPNTYIIKGRVTDNNNAGVSGVVVNLSGSSNASTTTDGVGDYSFSALAPGGTYTVSPSMLGRRFLPPNRTFTNLSSNQVSNFTASRVCIGLVCAQNGKIAFTRSGEIWTMNPDGSNQVNVTNNAAFDGGADWSPDGVQIVFTSNRDGNDEIYRKNSESDPNPTRLTNNPASDSSPRFSPNGASIVFTSTRDGNGEIYKMNADGSDQVRLTNDAAHDSSASFAPDGGKILWVRQNVTSPFGMTLYTMNSDGSNQQPLAGPFNFATSPSYSPDGTKIILVFGVDVTQQSIYTMNADGTGLSQSGIGRSQPAWSPDGTKVVHNCCFFQGPQFPNGLFVSNLAGPLGQRLTTDGNNESSPDWQPVSVPRRGAFDFDGDGRSDVSVYRPSNYVWYLLRSSAGFGFREWGLTNDVLVPADYDGDLKTDFAMWRPSDGNFYFINSFDNTFGEENFGLSGDIPTGGDWDGDGKADVAVFRESGPQQGFHYRGSMGNPNRNVSSIPWGVPGDKPVAGDYDGDGRTDAAVFRPSNGTWYVRQSSTGQLLASTFGLANDKLVPADYDGDGKTDIAVFRDGFWYLLRSAQGFTGIQFGISNDIPAPADYDGDGRADLAIYRNGMWWIFNSQSGAAEGIPFGQVGDVPIPSAYVR